MALHGFHPGILKHCSMHIINLGIAMHTNGASLFRGILMSTLFWFWADRKHEIWHICDMCMYTCMHACIASTMCTCLFVILCIQTYRHMYNSILFLVRSMLLCSGYFGDAASPVAVRLRAAYKEFRSWTRAEKISCSQPPFTERLAPRLILANISFQFQQFYAMFLFSYVDQGCCD